jgi:hypothetical protein
VAELSPVEVLNKSHDLSQFDCGTHESLNLWLKKFALQNQASESARTYVVHRGNVVVGYYPLLLAALPKKTQPYAPLKGWPTTPSQSACSAVWLFIRQSRGLALARRC